MFAPGRAKLSISPVATGSTFVKMTMGIVLVACLAARTAPRALTTSTSTLSCTSSATRSGRRPSKPCVAVLNQDVFSLDITELSQPLTERIGQRIGSG